MDPRSYVVTGETNISWSGEDEAHKVATQVVVAQLIHFILFPPRSLGTASPDGSTVRICQLDFMCLVPYQPHCYP